MNQSTASLNWWDELGEAVRGEVDQITGDWEIFSSYAKRFFEWINWTEPFIIALLSYHVFCLLLAYITRRSMNFQTFLWISFLLSAVSAQTINTYGNRYWAYFARKNYFEGSGFFISLLFTFPQLLLAVWCTMNFLFTAAGTLVKLKRAQARQQKSEAEKRKQNEKKDNTADRNKKKTN